MSRLDGFIMERCTGNIRVLNHVPYVHLFYNYNNRCIAIQPCEKDDDAIRFHRESSYSKTRIRWSRKSIADVLRGFLEEHNSAGNAETAGESDVKTTVIRPDESFTVDGTYYSDENVVIFDLKNARALKRKPAVRSCEKG